MRYIPYLTLQVSDVVTTGINTTMEIGELSPLGFNAQSIALKMAIAAITCVVIQRGNMPLVSKIVTAIAGMAVVWNCLIGLAAVIQRGM